MAYPKCLHELACARPHSFPPKVVSSQIHHLSQSKHKKSNQNHHVSIFKFYFCAKRLSNNHPLRAWKVRLGRADSPYSILCRDLLWTRGRFVSTGFRVANPPCRHGATAARVPSPPEEPASPCFSCMNDGLTCIIQVYYYKRQGGTPGGTGRRGDGRDRADSESVPGTTGGPPTVPVTPAAILVKL
jgi:hypothetical protein